MAAASASSSNTQVDTSGPIFFWKPEQPDGYLGQWYRSPFVDTLEDGTKVEYRNWIFFSVYISNPEIFLNPPLWVKRVVIPAPREAM
ncbi:hypothetical protein Dda_4499 [Drechslerella dactyloides]|uniref:Uncharacterized protein n=1 Tax=Drechslerella dactyloides TaxID=74499 RepID=A0AAD6NJC2_DREDA|nr:hypothetical protein Dda_4499 [Drechslerella dactyloides]